jgi:ribonuclease HI/transposase InsO family protein
MFCVVFLGLLLWVSSD